MKELDNLKQALEFEKSPLGFNYTISVKDLEKIVDDALKINKENKNLKHILTELEEWTKSEYDRYYNDKENLVFSNVEVIDFGRVLNKIQELKEKYK